jgi:hypothetical protein
MIEEEKAPPGRQVRYERNNHRPQGRLGFSLGTEPESVAAADVLRLGRTPLGGDELFDRLAKDGDAAAER